MTCQRCSNKAKEGTKHCLTHHSILAEYRRRHLRRKHWAAPIAVSTKALEDATSNYYDLSAWTRDVARLAELLR